MGFLFGLKVQDVSPRNPSLEMQPKQYFLLYFLQRSEDRQVYLHLSLRFPPEICSKCVVTLQRQAVWQLMLLMEFLTGKGI